MRNIVPSIQEDRVFSYDIEHLSDWLKKESFLPNEHHQKLMTNEGDLQDD